MLEKILEHKKLEVEHIRRRVSRQDVELMALDAAPARPFTKNFSDGINVIAEVKKASPSAGVIREDFNPTDIATIYAEHGAKALSVLTDENFFQGKLEYLTQIKAHLAGIHADPLPLLRKDFTVNEYQIFETRGAGADAILLIVAALDPFQLKDYQALSRELGLTVLVEVHDKPELDKALNIGAALIGINNRNLKTMQTDVQTTRELLTYLEETLKYVFPLVGKSGTRPQIISESGLKDRETIRDLRQRGTDGFLIGESLMKEKDFGAKLKEWVTQ